MSMFHDAAKAELPVMDPAAARQLMWLLLSLASE